MELKRLNIKRRDTLIISSNRTFMELKQIIILSTVKTEVSSNRTFMELKPFAECYLVTYLRVLIVPLWN